MGNNFLRFFAYDVNFRGGNDVSFYENIKREEVEVFRVEDGDTIELADGRYVRYIGIDSPEVKLEDDMKVEYFGKEAKRANEKLVDGKVVTLEYDINELDRLGRTLAYVLVDGKLVNHELAKGGYAKFDTWMPNNRYQNLFMSATVEAQEKKLGMWK
jgi:micrococcal nuclease